MRPRPSWFILGAMSVLDYVNQRKKANKKLKNESH